MKAETLRKSILQYAIQGKLVPQIASEEPARELLKKIKAEKDELIQQGKIKEPKALPAIGEGEKAFEIPDSWEWVRLGDCINISSGNNLTSKQMSKNGNIPVYGGNGITGYHDKANVNQSVLVIGRVGFYCGSIHITKPLSWITDNAFIVSYPVNFIYLNFLFILLKHLDLGKRSVATAQPVISGKSVYPIVFPLPPLEEQKRIVARIEELMLLVDEYEKKQIELEKLEKEFPEKLKKSVLQYAIQGKLVPQIDTEESASELLQKIKAEKDELIQQKKIKEPKVLPPITEDEKPFEIPDSWEWVRLGNVLEVNPRNTLEDEIDVSFIPMTLLNDKYQNTFSFEVRKWKDVKKGFTHFRNSDVVVAKIVPCFQNLKSAVMRGLENGHGAGTTELHILRQNELHIEPSLLLWFVKSPYFILNGEQIMTGTAGQQRVSTDYIKTVLFPLPPREEQKRIVSHIEELFKLVDLLSSGGKLKMGNINEKTKEIRDVNRI